MATIRIPGVTDQPPPHDERVEQAVLGSMMLAREAIDTVLEVGVTERFFYLVRHQLVFRAITRMHADQKEIDPITMIAELKMFGDLADVGGEMAVHALLDCMPSAANITSYLATLTQLYQTRCRQISASEAIRLLQIGETEQAQKLLKMAAKPVDKPPEKPLPAPPGASARAEAGSLPDLDESELAALVRSLRTLRRVSEEPGTASPQQLGAAFIFLVPFANGRQMSEEMADGSASFERAWLDAVTSYNNPDRAGTASVAQKIIEHLRAEGREDVLPISHGYGIHAGAFVQRKVSFKDGKWVEDRPTPMTNFTCWVVSQEFQDDGTGEVQRRIRMAGEMSWGQPLSEFEMPAEEWTNISNWLHKNWGHSVVIFDRRTNGARVLEAIALLSLDAPTRHVYTHTGWITTGGNHVFIAPKGAVGLEPDQMASFLERSTVAVDHAYRHYRVAPACTREDAIEGYRWLERFMRIADLSVTAPMVSALFLAPLASRLPLSFILAFCGPSDSRKSSLVAAAMTAYGREFTSDTMTMSFQFTANRIENVGFLGKDLPIIVDNYVPSTNPEHARTLMRLAHSIGDNAARGRMLDGHRSLQAKPVRGMMIITGEEQAAQYSSGARMYLVPMNRGTVNLPELTELQVAGAAGKLEPAITHYLLWLSQKLKDDTFISGLRARWFDESRKAQQASADHGRLIAQRMWLNIGLDLARASHPNGRWSDATLPIETTEKLNEAGVERGITVRQSSIVSTFFSSIKLLIDTGKVVGGHSAQKGHPPSIHADVFGWSVNSVGLGVNKLNDDAALMIWVDHDEDRRADAPWFVYLNARAMLQMISRELRDPMQDSEMAVSAALEGDGMLWVEPKERGRGTRSVPKSLPGAGRQRVLRISGPAMIKALGLD